MARWVDGASGVQGGAIWGTCRWQPTLSGLTSALASVGDIVSSVDAAAWCTMGRASVATRSIT